MRRISCWTAAALFVRDGGAEFRQSARSFGPSLLSCAPLRGQDCLEGHRIGARTGHFGGSPIHVSAAELSFRSSPSGFALVLFLLPPCRWLPACRSGGASESLLPHTLWGLCVPCFGRIASRCRLCGLIHRAIVFLPQLWEVSGGHGAQTQGVWARVRRSFQDLRAAPQISSFPAYAGPSSNCGPAQAGPGAIRACPSLGFS